MRLGRKGQVGSTGGKKMKTWDELENRGRLPRSGLDARREPKRMKLQGLLDAGTCGTQVEREQAGSIA